MPRRKKQKAKRETRRDKIDKALIKQLVENAEKAGQEEIWPDDHYLATHRTEDNKLLHTTIAKEIIHGGGCLKDKYRLIGQEIAEKLRQHQKKYYD